MTLRRAETKRWQIIDALAFAREGARLVMVYNQYFITERREEINYRIYAFGRL